MSHTDKAQQFKIPTYWSFLTFLSFLLWGASFGSPSSATKKIKSIKNSHENRKVSAIRKKDVLPWQSKQHK